MALAERLLTGLSLTVLGMGLVFLLLVLLWGLLTLMLRLDREPSPERAPWAGGMEIAPTANGTARPLPGSPDPELVSAITVAVLTHQSVRRKQAAPIMRSHWPGSLLYASRWVAAGRHQQIENWHPRKH